jgi:hypothetical protein
LDPKGVLKAEENVKLPPSLARRPVEVTQVETQSFFEGNGIVWHGVIAGKKFSVRDILDREECRRTHDSIPMDLSVSI